MTAVDALQIVVSTELATSTAKVLNALRDLAVEVTYTDGTTEERYVMGAYEDQDNRVVLRTCPFGMGPYGETVGHYVADTITKVEVL